MPPFPKLVLGPNSKPVEMFGSAEEMLNCGKVALPGRVIPSEPGLNFEPVEAKAFSRVKPKCCSQVRFGESTTEFDTENTWLPADNCCANPSRDPTAPKGLLVGSL